MIIFLFYKIIIIKILIFSIIFLKKQKNTKNISENESTMTILLLKVLLIDCSVQKYDDFNIILIDKTNLNDTINL